VDALVEADGPGDAVDKRTDVLLHPFEFGQQAVGLAVEMLLAVADAEFEGGTELKEAAAELGGLVLLAGGGGALAQGGLSGASEQKNGGAEDADQGRGRQGELGALAR
jgi:hypothetical protein